MANFPLGLLAQGSGAAAADFELISTTLVSVATANIQFASISSAYKHLRFHIVGRSSLAATYDNLAFYVNNDTGANYSTHSVYNQAATVSSNSFTGSVRLYIPSQFAANSNTSSAFSGVVLDFLDYANTTTYKSIRALNGVGNASSSGMISLVSGSWRSTSAITQVNFENSGNFMVGTRISLYGIRG